MAHANLLLKISIGWKLMWSKSVLIMRSSMNSAKLVWYYYLVYGCVIGSNIWMYSTFHPPQLFEVVCRIFLYIVDLEYIPCNIEGFETFNSPHFTLHNFLKLCVIYSFISLTWNTPLGTLKALNSSSGYKPHKPNNAWATCTYSHESCCKCIETTWRNYCEQPYLSFIQQKGLGVISRS